MTPTPIKMVKDDEQHVFVCDCNSGEFYLVAPDEVHCSQCGLILPDIVWIITRNGESVITIE